MLSQRRGNTMDDDDLNITLMDVLRGTVAAMLLMGIALFEYKYPEIFGYILGYAGLGLSIFFLSYISSLIFRKDE